MGGDVTAAVSYVPVLRVEEHDMQQSMSCSKHVQSVVINTINLIDKKTSKLLTFQKQR